jgi:hypothetical protein
MEPCIFPAPSDPGNVALCRLIITNRGTLASDHFRFADYTPGIVVSCVQRAAQAIITRTNGRSLLAPNLVPMKSLRRVYTPKRGHCSLPNFVLAERKIEMWGSALERRNAGSLREVNAAHQGLKARVGAERVKLGKHLQETCEIGAPLIALFEPGDCLILVTQTRVDLSKNVG